MQSALTLLGELRSAEYGHKTLLEALRRPEVELAQLELAHAELAALHLSSDERVAIETEIKYAGYVTRERDAVARLQRQESLEIPLDLDLLTLTGLGNEARNKLAQLRPRTLGQASRIAGVRPPDVALLAVHVERFKRERAARS